MAKLFEGTDTIPESNGNMPEFVLNHDFTVVDMETADPKLKRICSIGITRIEHGEIILPTQYYLVNPECEINKFCQLKHHIMRKEVQDKPAFPEIWEKVRHLFHDAIVVAHNAKSADLSYFNANFKHYGIREEPFHFLDTQQIAYAGKGTGLDALCREFGITLDNHHNAGSDSLATAQLLKAFWERIPGLRLESHLEEYVFDRDVETYVKPTAPPAQNQDTEKTVVPDIPFDEPPTEIAGKTIILTGEFETMDRRIIMRILEERGMCVSDKKLPSSKTDILLVGKKGSDQWKDGIGTKTMEAVKLRNQGKKIKIIREEDFAEFLKMDEFF